MKNLFSILFFFCAFALMGQNIKPNQIKKANDPDDKATVLMSNPTTGVFDYENDGIVLPYNAASTYSVNDIVSFGGYIYRSAANSNVSTPSVANWQLITGTPATLDSVVIAEDSIIRNYFNGSITSADTIRLLGSGIGDVVGPASATDNAVTRFDLTTGKLIQDSGVTIDDSGNIATAGTVDGRDVSVDGALLDEHSDTLIVHDNRLVSLEQNKVIVDDTLTAHNTRIVALESRGGGSVGVDTTYVQSVADSLRNEIGDVSVVANVFFSPNEYLVACEDTSVFLFRGFAIDRQITPSTPSSVISLTNNSGLDATIDYWEASNGSAYYEALVTLEAGSWLIESTYTNGAESAYVDYQINVKALICPDSLSGTSDGVVTSGTYSDITENLSLIVASPGTSPVVIGLSTIATDNEVSTITGALVSQVEAEAGTVTSVRRWTPERVKQAIAALQTDDQTGSEVSLTDAGNFFTTDNAEAALQETASRHRYTNGTTYSADPSVTITPNPKQIIYFDSGTGGWTQLFAPTNLKTGDSFFAYFISTESSSMVLDLTTGSFQNPTISGDYGTFTPTYTVTKNGMLEFVWNGFNILVRDGIEDEIQTSNLDSLVTALQTFTDSTTLTVNLEGKHNKIVEWDMTGVSNAGTITLAEPLNAFGSTTEAGVYTFVIFDCDTHDFDFPASFRNMGGSTAYDAGTTVEVVDFLSLTCYFNGTIYRCQ